MLLSLERQNGTQCMHSSPPLSTSSPHLLKCTGVTLLSHTLIHKHMHTHTHFDQRGGLFNLWEFPCVLLQEGPPPLSYKERKKIPLFLLHKSSEASQELPFGVGSFAHSVFSSTAPLLPSSFSSSSSHTQFSRCSLSCDPFTARPPSIFHRSP